MSNDRSPMRWLHVLGLGKPSPDESAALEVEHHIAELADRLVAEGMAVEEARREAERHFGDRTRYTAKMRRLEEASLRGDHLWTSAEVLRQSLVSVARTARREPGFTAAVVLTLALGIGANATMYGIVDRLLLRGPEHVVDPERVVRVYANRTLGRAPELVLQNNIAYPDYVDLRLHSGFAGVAAYTPQGDETAGDGATATHVAVVRASAELFPVLGVTPALGRFYTSDESQPGAIPTAVIGFEYWVKAYGEDPNVLGRSIEVRGERFTIIGVAPRDFTGVDLERVDVWLPLESMLPFTRTPSCRTSRSCYGLNVVARLRAGEPREAAEARATSIHLNGRQEMIADGRYSARASIVLAPLIVARGPEASAESRVARWLAGVSIVVLLIACANVANLMLARGIKLQREIGVRLALGAGRTAIVAGAVVESVILGTVGGIAALAIIRWGGELVRSTLLPDVHFPAAALTPRAIAFTLLTAMVAGILAGLLPALHGGRTELASRLYRDGPGASRRRSGARGVLTLAQAGMTAALLVAAGLFVRSLGQLRAIDLGLDVDRLVMVTIEYQDINDPRKPQVASDARARVRTLPAVAISAAMSHGIGQYASLLVRPSHVDSMAALPGGGPWFHAVDPDYFETVGLAVIHGRGIEPGDREDTEGVAVISETMASVFWPDTDPIGECLVLANAEGCSYRVVGIVQDAARTGYIEDPSPVYYLPLSQGPPNLGAGALYVRARESADDELVDAVASVLRGFSPIVRNVQVMTVRDHLDPQARSWTLGATMFTIFGLLALVVAAVGLYSVLAFDVAQRTREIGVRTALGARKARLLGTVVAQGTFLGGIGVALGLGAAYLAAPYVQDLLFETSPRDPTVFTTVAIVLLAVSVAASLVPALRATRVDPVAALKTE
jgi:predicted permease